MRRDWKRLDCIELLFANACDARLVGDVQDSYGLSIFSNDFYFVVWTNSAGGFYSARFTILRDYYQRRSVTLFYIRLELGNGSVGRLISPANGPLYCVQTAWPKTLMVGK